MTKDDKHFFISLAVIYFSFFVRCLFQVFAHHVITQAQFFTWTVIWVLFVEFYIILVSQSNEFFRGNNFCLCWSSLRCFQNDHFIFTCRILHGRIPVLHMLSEERRTPSQLSGSEHRLRSEDVWGELYDGGCIYMPLMPHLYKGYHNRTCLTVWTSLELTHVRLLRAVCRVQEALSKYWLFITLLWVSG